MGEVRPSAPLAAVGEGPGLTEVREGGVFRGPSGQEYNIALDEGGLSRDEVTTVNVLGCMSPGGDLTAFLEKMNREHRRACKRAEKAGLPLPKAPKSPIECCMPRLEHDLIISNSKVLLAIGGKALQALAGHFGVPYGTGADETGKVIIASIKNQHGSPVQMPDGRVLCSSLHPAFAMRERHYKHVVRNDIARAARIAARGGRIDWVEPAYVLFPSIDKIEAMCSAFVANKDKILVTADIETDSANTQTCLVRCIGLGAVLPGQTDETIIVVPFRWMDGRDYWVNPADEERARLAVRRVLDQCKLVLHNGAFDTNICQRVGLMTPDAILKPSVMKRFFDSMVGHHDTDDNDLPHDLGFVARRYLEAPLWKKDVDHKASAGVARDSDLHLYNAKDILCTSRAWHFVDRRIAECGTQKQFETDSALAPITREMTNLGVPVDENHRGKLSLKFNALTSEMRADFQRMAGKDINPRSPTQLGTWLYEDLGYDPPLNPQGYEWEEGDDWSTSGAALLRLIDQGVDEQTEQAIDRLLQFRACETLRGRYIDGLDTSYETHEEFKLLGRAEAVEVDSKIVLPERPAISIIHPSWKIHVIPTGRWSSEPNVQNIPARVWALPDETGVRKPTNLRKLMIAPPDHVFIGADFDQIELRIVAARAMDRLLLRAFAEKMDPHSMNAATLFAPSAEQVMAVYEELMAMENGSADDQARRKYIRTIAKRFCAAKGTFVLTNRGEVPIEDVRTCDKVWDGIEWVSHGGVVCRGEKEVIEYDGLVATPDHKVWLRSGEQVEFAQAAARGESLARTGEGKRPIRVVEGFDACMGAREPASSLGKMHRLWSSENGGLREFAGGEVETVYALPGTIETKSRSQMVAIADERSTATMHQSQIFELGELWRARNQIQISQSRRGGILDNEQSWIEQIAGNRSNRQQRPLRTRQHSFGRQTHECTEPPLLCSGSGLGVSSMRMAFQEENCHGQVIRREDSRGDSRGSDRDNSFSQEKLEGRAKKVLVYDLLNAGPRRRYTAANVLISNCFLEYYGGETEKLYSVMAAERDKATGERVFYDLTPKKVLDWHKRFHAAHPEIKEWHNKIAEEVRRNGFTKALLDDRKRFFPGGPAKKNAPPNHEIQGTSAAIANDSVIRLCEEIPFRSWSKWTGLCLQVHDQLVAIVPDSRAEEAIKIFEKCMYHEVPLDGEGKIAITAKAKASKDLARQG